MCNPALQTEVTVSFGLQEILAPAAAMARILLLYGALMLNLAKATASTGASSTVFPGQSGRDPAMFPLGSLSLIRCFIFCTDVYPNQRPHAPRPSAGTTKTAMIQLVSARTALMECALTRLLVAVHQLLKPTQLKSNF